MASTTAARIKHLTRQRLTAALLLVSASLIPAARASSVATVAVVAEVPAGGTFFDVSINNQGNVAYRAFVPGVGDIIGYGNGLDADVEIVRVGDEVEAGQFFTPKPISVLDGVSLDDDDEIALNLRYAGGSAVVIVRPPFPVAWPPPAAQFELVADSNNFVVASEFVGPFGKPSLAGPTSLLFLGQRLSPAGVQLSVWDGTDVLSVADLGLTSLLRYTRLGGDGVRAFVEDQHFLLAGGPPTSPIPNFYPWNDDGYTVQTDMDGDIVATNGSSSVTIVPNPGPAFGGLALNNALDIAYVDYLDPGVPNPLARFRYAGRASRSGPILMDGDALLGSTVESVLDDQHVDINEPGQIAFTARLVDGRHVLLRADPPGTQIANPIMPSQIKANGQPVTVRYTATAIPCSRLPTHTPGTICLGVITSVTRWIDPPVATGFLYELDPADPPFASVIVPDPLPLGDGDFMLHFAGNSVPITAGVPFDFTDVVPAGVMTFTIDEIDPAEGIDGTTVPFVIGVDHTDVADEIDMTITAVPEPGLLLLQAASLACLVGFARSRERSSTCSAPRATRCS